MKTYLRILRYTRPHKDKILSYIVFTLLAVLFGTLALFMLAPVMNVLFYFDKLSDTVKAQPTFSFSPHFLQQWVQYKVGLFDVNYGKSAALLFAIMVVVSFNLTGNLFRFLGSRNLGTIRTRLVEDLRRSAYDRLVAKEVAYLENSRKGDIVSRVTSDVAEVENSVVVTFESVIRDPLSIIFALAMLISISWQLTLFIFLVLPITSTAVGRISKALKRDAKDSQSVSGRILSIVDETVGGIRIVKAFHAERYITDIFDVHNRRYSRLTRKQWHNKALVPVFSESAMVGVVGFTLWFGGNQVFNGHLTAPVFFSYMSMLYLLIAPLKSLSNAFGNIYKGLASAERVFEMMDIAVTIKDSPDAIAVDNFESTLEINHVSFAYIKDQVLKDIDLKIEKGKVYALVGPSGGGKSTLAELVLRFYDPTEGTLLLDGKDLRHIKLESLRNLTAVVTQDPILFNDTIYNNIAFGMPHVTREAVEQAAIAANAHGFIMESAEGYETSIGDRGGLLSGGQRQRLSIARAILKNPAILVLDEATSALDTSSEKIVQDALYKLMEHRTSIVIAHRLSTIQDADEIIVIDKGRIVEKGSHQELIARKGLYSNLYQLQQLEN